jgi:1-acyl-sn-glycerol-3-phosphate acyltransferase/uncharacterized protein with GYD domain
MPRYIVMSKLSATGLRSAKSGPDGLSDVLADIERAGGKVVEQHAVLGPFDFFTVIDVRDNDTAQLVELGERQNGHVTHELIPAIDLSLFARLMGRSTENTGPYKWQVSWPARLVRRAFEGHAYLNVTKQYFKPLTVLGAEKFDTLGGKPAIFIANHTSFMDGPAVFAALPKRYRRKTAWPAAADRFFVKGRKEFRKQGWWFSLVYNSFPMKRGGGKSALAYTGWLIEKGWSIVIFPEGARTSSAKLARFRMGPAILATTHGLPVVPMYLEGLAAIRPKGSQAMTPGPVVVRVGDPIRFPPGTDAADANRVLHRAVSAMGHEAAEARRAARAASMTVDLRDQAQPAATPEASVSTGR